MSQYKAKALGIAWYKEEDYLRLKDLFVDGHTLPDTFNEWLDKAQNLFNQHRTKGHIVEKVYIDPNTFPDWCRGRGLDIDTNARSEFASEFVARKYINQN